jgi:hypothetical protein
MKHILGILFALGLHHQAHAYPKSTVYGYDQAVPREAQSYLRLVDENAPSEGAPSCEPMFRHMKKDGVIDIRYALGYFDDSTGKENIWNGVNYGYSPTLDIPVYESLRSLFTARCPSRTQRLCGFKENGEWSDGKVVLEKYMVIQGERVLVRITMTQASATESHDQNKGEFANRQAFLTSQAEANFFGGLHSADIVFYNGHSRDGGGPDFKMPVLNSAKKDNYIGYYHIKKEGITRTMKALDENPNKEIIVGFFSCYARLHFYDTFMKANPHQRVILSADTINYFDALDGSLGYLEGLLRGSCGEELNNLARQKESVRKGFQGFNLY